MHARSEPTGGGSATAPERSETAEERLAGLAYSAWLLDPERSRIEFETPFYWGFGTVKGRFSRYLGILDLGRLPAIELTIEAGSLTTGNAHRDRRLRSPDFFDVERHPYVRFVSDLVRLDGDSLAVHGGLSARGREIELELEPTVVRTDAGYELSAVTYAMHRGLGITWNPVGITRPYSKLVVAGELICEPRESQGSHKRATPARRGWCDRAGRAGGWCPSR